MTKRIVSGIFILTALGALGVILAGALTSGEQLIVRFLTAVIVAALGLYVISDLRLQADDDAMTARTGGHPRIPTSEVPANSTAAFMATVTKRGDKDGEDGEALDGELQEAEVELTAVADADSEANKQAKTPALATTNGNGADGEESRADRQLAEVGATASSTTEMSSAVVEAADSNGGSPGRRGHLSVAASAPETVRAVGISPPKDITLVDLFPNQMNGGGESPDEAGQVDAAEVAASTPSSYEPAIGGADQPDSDVTAEMKHMAIFDDGQDRLTAAANQVSGSPKAETTDAEVEAIEATDAIAQTESVDADVKDIDSKRSEAIEVDIAGAKEDDKLTVPAAEFEYSDELQSPEYEWPTPPAKPVETSVQQPHPFEKASAAYQAEKERLAAAASSESLPVPATSQELQATEYADAPLAPIIDLRDVNGLTSGPVDAAINAGEVEVIATLIEQGMLSTDGPISDRDVRTMVYVAFTSNELRKLLMAGGSPDGPNYGLDLGPVELFDERIHAPAPKTLYAGAPQSHRPAQRQIG